MGFVLFRYKKDFSVPEVPNNPAAAAVRKSAEGNALISVKDWIINRYNIPSLTTEQLAAMTQNLAFSTVRQHNRAYTKADGTAGTTQVAEFKRIASITVKRGQPVAIPHPEHKGVNNTPLYVGIKMPSFFTIPMICQALGQMITTNKPLTFRMSRTNQDYPIIYNSTDGLIEGWAAGAWVVTTDATDINTDDTNAPDGTQLYGPPNLFELAF